MKLHGIVLWLKTLLVVVRLWCPLGAGATAAGEPSDPGGGWIEFKGPGWAGPQGRFYVPKGKGLDRTALVERLKDDPFGAMSMLEAKMGEVSTRRLEIARYRTYLANVLVDAGLNPGTAAMYINDGLGPSTARMLLGHPAVARARSDREKAGPLRDPVGPWQTIPLLELGEAMRGYLQQCWPALEPPAEPAASARGDEGGWIEFKGPGLAEPDLRFHLPKGNPPNLEPLREAVGQRPLLAMSILELRMAQRGLPGAQRTGYRDFLARVLTDRGFNPGAAATYAQEGLSANLARTLFGLYAAEAGRTTEDPVGASSDAGLAVPDDSESELLAEADPGPCMANLQLIERAKELWAAANGKSHGDPVDWAGPGGACNYLPGGEDALPCCPSDGVYTMNSVGVRPTCSIHGPGPAVPSFAVPRLPCRVLDVLDGDTIVVELLGRTERVRLLRVNTPEKGRPAFPEAKAFLELLTKGMAVGLEFEPPDERDAYGRLLCYVFAEGTHVNVEIVRAGWSPFWTKYGEGRYALAFRLAEIYARSSGAGLWRNLSGLPTDAVLPH